MVDQTKSAIPIPIAMERRKTHVISGRESWFLPERFDLCRRYISYKRGTLHHLRRNEPRPGSDGCTSDKRPARSKSQSAFPSTTFRREDSADSGVPPSGRRSPSRPLSYRLLHRRQELETVCRGSLLCFGLILTTLPLDRLY